MELKARNLLWETSDRKEREHDKKWWELSFKRIGLWVEQEKEKNTVFYEKIDALEKALSLDYLSQVITVGKKQFIFGPPTTPKEEKQQARIRKKLIKLLLQDAAHVLVEEGMHDYYDTNIAQYCSENDSAWDKVNAILKHIPTREQVQSPIDPSSIEEIRLDADEHKRKVGLNYGSYQVQMQDPSITGVGEWDLDNKVKSNCYLDDVCLCGRQGCSSHCNPDSCVNGELPCIKCGTKRGIPINKIAGVNL